MRARILFGAKAIVVGNFLEDLSPPDRKGSQKNLLFHQNS